MAQPHRMSDAALDAFARQFVRDLRNGSVAADEVIDRFEVLFVHTSSRIARYVYLIAGSRLDRDDVVQDFFVKLWNGGLRRYDPDQGIPVTAWMMTVARNLTIDKLRALKSEGASVSIPPDPELWSFGHDVAIAVSNPARAERAAMLVEAFAALKPVPSLVARRFFLDGCRMKEIAAELGITVAMVGYHIREVRKVLKRYLSGR